MRALLFILTLSLSAISYAQDFHVEGSVKIEDMELENQVDSVVVRQSDGTLGVRDVSSLSEFKPYIKRVGSVQVDGADKSIFLSGEYAYTVGEGNQEFKIVNISKSSSAYVQSSLELGGLCKDIKVAGRYAYIVDHEMDRLIVIDVSNPSAPANIAEITVNKPNAIFISAQYAYIAADANTYIVDISDPTKPVLHSSVFFDPLQEDIYVREPYAYIASVGKFSVIDISNSFNPFKVEDISDNRITSPASIHVRGITAFVAAGDGIYCFDNLPNLGHGRRSSPFIGNPRDIFVSGKYIFFVEHDLKVAAESALNKIALRDLGALGNKVHVSGPYVYVVGGGELQIYEISGGDFVSLNAHSFKAGNVLVESDIVTQGQLYVNGGVNVGAGGLFSDGDIGVSGTVKVSHAAVTGGEAGLEIGNSEIITDKRWWRFYVQHGDGDMLLYNSRSTSTNGIAGEFKATTGTYNALSDRRLKKNIEGVNELLPKLSNLDVYKYHMTSEDVDDSKHYGLIAQEVQEYFPELVHYDSDSDVYRLEYSTLGVLAIQAIKEQQEIIEKQDHEIKEIRKMLEQLIANRKSK